MMQRGTKSMRKLSLLTIAGAMTLGVAACGGGGGGGSGSSGVTVGGNGIKGNLNSSTVSVTNAAGGVVTNSCSTSANGSGSYSCGLSGVAATDYPLVISFTGGTDALTGQSPVFPLKSVVSSEPTGTTVNINALPQTTMMVQAAQAQVGAGNSLNATALSNASKKIGKVFGMGINMDSILSGDLNVDATSATSKKDFQKILKASEALSETIRRMTDTLTNVDATVGTGSAMMGSDDFDNNALISVMDYLAQDASDGELNGAVAPLNDDGTVNTGGASIPLTSVTLPGGGGLSLGIDRLRSEFKIQKANVQREVIENRLTVAYGLGMTGNNVPTKTVASGLGNLYGLTTADLDDSLDADFITDAVSNFNEVVTLLDTQDDLGANANSLKMLKNSFAAMSTVLNTALQTELNSATNDGEISLGTDLATLDADVQSGLIENLVADGVNTVNALIQFFQDNGATVALDLTGSGTTNDADLTAIIGTGTLLTDLAGDLGTGGFSLSDLLDTVDDILDDDATMDGITSDDLFCAGYLGDIDGGFQLGMAEAGTSSSVYMVDYADGATASSIYPSAVTLPTSDTGAMTITTDGSLSASNLEKLLAGTSSMGPEVVFQLGQPVLNGVTTVGGVNSITVNDGTNDIVCHPRSDLLNATGMPVGSGYVDVTMTLTDGSDGTRASGERQISVDYTVEWTSNGTTLTIAAEAGGMADVTYYTASSDNENSAVLSNMDLDLLEVTASSGGNLNQYPTLRAKIANLVAQDTALGTLLGDLQEAGSYHYQISFDGFPLLASNSVPFFSVSGTFNAQ